MKIITASLVFLLVAVSCKKAPMKPSFGSSSSESDAGSEDLKEGEDESYPSEDEDQETGKTDETDNTTQPDKGSKEIATPNTFELSLVKLEAAPKKGETAQIKLAIANKGSKSGKTKIAPFLTAKDFEDYSEIRLPSLEISLSGTEKKDVEFKIEPFFKEEGGNREYALNKGNYSLKFKLEGDYSGEWANSDFAVQGSNAVFTAVYWSQPYLDKQGYRGSIQDYLRETFTRKSQTSNGANLFASYDKGFDQMMGVRTMFKIYDNWRPDFSRWDGVQILEQVEEEGKKRLGLKQKFQGSSGEDMTHNANHGYDMSIGLTEHGFGGLAWVGGNTQASGVFDGDTSVGRSQMVMIHETGHNYGAPHCDPIQGFVMCSGEKHDHYTNGDLWFVWHDVSIEKMVKAKRMLQNQNQKAAAFSLAPASISSRPVKHVLIHD